MRTYYLSRGLLLWVQLVIKRVGKREVSEYLNTVRVPGNNFPFMHSLPELFSYSIAFNLGLSLGSYT